MYKEPAAMALFELLDNTEITCMGASKIPCNDAETQYHGGEHRRSRHMERQPC